MEEGGGASSGSIKIGEFKTPTQLLMADSRLGVKTGMFLSDNLIYLKHYHTSMLKCGATQSACRLAA